MSNDSVSIEPGTRVRFTANRLGLIEPEVPFRGFEESYVGKGDEGTYKGPDPNTAHWHVVEVEVEGKTFDCPVAESHFEVVS